MFVLIREVEQFKTAIVHIDSFHYNQTQKLFKSISYISTNKFSFCEIKFDKNTNDAIFKNISVLQPNLQMHRVTSKSF